MWEKRVLTANDTGIIKTFTATEESVRLHNREVNALEMELNLLRNENAELKKRLKEAGE